ncbi:uncharacterized protein LOC144097446 [Amblyomma americanum]
MTNYENFRRGENEAIYSDGFLSTARGHRYYTEPPVVTEFCLSSTAELISPQRAPFEAHYSCPHLVSLATQSPAVPLTTSMAIGVAERESSSTSLAEGLPSKGLDCMPLLVFVLVLCVFITLAIWATGLVQDELHDSNIEAVDRGDAGKHFAKFGGLKPSADASKQKRTKKQVPKITARTGRPTKGKRTSTTLDDIDVTTTSLQYRTVDNEEDDHQHTSDIGGQYTGELIGTGTSDSEGRTVTRSLKPIHRRRHLPHKKRKRRSTRRRASKRVYRSGASSSTNRSFREMRF